MNNNNSNSSCCINDILKVIKVLQDRAECIDDIPNTCDRPFLGAPSVDNAYVLNTRPVTLYHCNNDLFEANYTLGETTGTSSIFRIENVMDNAATLRVLAPNPTTTAGIPYVATDSFITVNCPCICAIRCLADTFVDNV